MTKRENPGQIRQTGDDVLDQLEVVKAALHLALRELSNDQGGTVGEALKHLNYAKEKLQKMIEP